MKNKKVLLIEDTELEAKLIQGMFVNFLPNIQLSLIDKVDDGIDELIKNEYDLLIFNIGLKDLNGNDLIDKIIPAHAPNVIILINATKNVVNKDLEKILKLKLLDVVGYLVKPIDEKNFISLVNSTLINFNNK